jgi:hypothetical protein
MYFFLQRLLGQSSYGGDLNWPDVSTFSSGDSTSSGGWIDNRVAQRFLRIVETRKTDPSASTTVDTVLGKAVAGILLYIAAVGLPLTCAMAWMAIPGHLPMPFDAHLVLPVIADVLCGLVYYFAGLLSGMRDARWYASRVMGIGMGIVCSIALSVVTEFWQAAICCALGVVMTSASAWGTFVQGGRFESQSRIMRFATGVSIAAGLLITGAVVFAVGASFLPAFVSNSKDTRYRITGDGVILQAVYDDNIIVEVRIFGQAH